MYLLLGRRACGGLGPKATYESRLHAREEAFHVDPPPRWQPVKSAGDLAWRAPDATR